MCCRETKPTRGVVSLVETARFRQAMLYTEA
jgi:hypothetical protein